MAKKKIQIAVHPKHLTLEPGETWQCTCGVKHKLSAYVSAHWDIVLHHTCEGCGANHRLQRGNLCLVKSAPTKKRTKK